MVGPAIGAANGVARDEDMPDAGAPGVKAEPGAQGPGGPPSARGGGRDGGSEGGAAGGGGGAAAAAAGDGFSEPSVSEQQHPQKAQWVRGFHESNQSPAFIAVTLTHSDVSGKRLRPPRAWFDGLLGGALSPHAAGVSLLRARVSGWAGGPPPADLTFHVFAYDYVKTEYYLQGGDTKTLFAAWALAPGDAVKLSRAPPGSASPARMQVVRAAANPYAAAILAASARAQARRAAQAAGGAADKARAPRPPPSARRGGGAPPGSARKRKGAPPARAALDGEPFEPVEFDDDFAAAAVALHLADAAADANAEERQRRAAEGGAAAAGAPGAGRGRGRRAAGPPPALGQPLPPLADAGLIYLDYAATTPVYPEVAAAVRPFLEPGRLFGNPSAGYGLAAQAAAAAADARARVASLIGAGAAADVVLASCGTEADAAAVWGAVGAARARARPGAPRPHVVASAVEHAAVLGCLRMLARQGLADHTLVAVGPDGRVDPADVAAALTDRTCLLTLMHANNETGALQPVAQTAAAAAAFSAARAARDPDAAPVLVHCDAAQTAGKLPLDVGALGVDMLTVVGHKFGAPKGVAALYVRPGVELEPLLCGGGQEGGRRAGTECTPLAAALGAAAALAEAELEAAVPHARALRDRLAAALTAGLAGVPGVREVRVHGPAEPGHRLPGLLSVGVDGVDAAELLAALGDRVAASAGAACHGPGCRGAGREPSAVLTAMGVPRSLALGTMRLSVGRHTTEAEVDAAARLICEEVEAQLAARRAEEAAAAELEKAEADAAAELALA